MLGIFLIYFLGKSFYKLAEEYEKNKWLYAILSVVAFYGIQIILGILIGLFYPEFLDDSLAVSVIGVIVSGLGMWGIHSLVKNHLEKNKIEPFSEIDNIGKE